MMSSKQQSRSAENIQEAEIVGQKHSAYKKQKLKRGDYIIFLVWLLSIFGLVISARLITLPSDEFPVWLTILITCISLYVVFISYSATLTPGSTRALLPNLFAIALMYVVPALITVAVVNGIVPKTKITRMENDIIGVQYDGYNMTFWFDADVTYYRPFVNMPPFNTMEAYVGNAYYDGGSYDMGGCIDNHKSDFYSGKTIRCLVEDGTSAGVTLQVDKLSYKK